MKKLIPAYIISFVSGFMILIYEPLNMYACNINDFWFDIYTILKPLVLDFIIYFIGLSILYTMVYIINKRFSEKLILYKIVIVFSVILLIALYIQGNFMIGNLPSLDGTTIEWQNYKVENIVSPLMWGLVAIIITFITIKFKYDRTIKTYSFVIVAIFIMLSVSLISILMKPEVFNKKELMVVSTNKNLHQASTDKNFFIFVADSIDSKTFEEIMNNSEWKDTFEDFTYYPDTMCGYPFTRNSMPQIISGIWYENEIPYSQYYDKAFENSKIINKVREENYDIGFYDYEYKWTGKNWESLKNIGKLNGRINNIMFLRQAGKYIMFKYLPQQLKPLAKIETMDFDRCKFDSNFEAYSWDDRVIYFGIQENEIEKIDDKVFKYIHIEGGHVPFFYDKDLNIVGEWGTYEMKVEATLHIINSWINRLKEAGVYDNSSIIVMSDHGYNGNTNIGRQNPIFFVKGINEHHEMYTSDIPISYGEDLNDAYIQLLNGDNSQELFKNVDNNRKRRYLLYEGTEENHLDEYEQTGKAWDESTLVPTGNYYETE